MSVAVSPKPTFGEKLARFCKTVTCRPIQDPCDLEDVFRLRHDAYVRNGGIAPSVDRRFADRYDELQNVWIFGLYLDGELASSIRVHLITPDYPYSPSLDVFGDVLGPEVEKGRWIVDPTRFVTDAALARDHPELPYVTARLGFLATERFRAHLGLASVRAEHRAFYRRLFGLKSLCSPRAFPHQTGAFCLLGVDYLSVRHTIVDRYPFMRSSADELAALFDAGSIAIGARGSERSAGDFPQPIADPFDAEPRARA